MTLTRTAEPHEGTTLVAGPRAQGGHLSLVTMLFAVTAFLGAAMLFVIQPLVARMLLPSYGGSATVWSTSSLFFQSVLLFSYWYVHWSTNTLGSRWQPRTQVLLLVLPLSVLPIALPTDAAPTADSSPALWLLRALVLLVGLPFGVLATTGPLLQRWYSWTGGERAQDPYFLYAASNFGSFVGLLSYPFLIEPRIALADQRQLWSWGFVGFVVLATVCAGVSYRRSADCTVATRVASVPAAQAGPPLTRRRVLRWGVLAFLPSGLMLAVTSHLSTDVASIPLLWVVPLAIYLATYIVAFGRSTRDRPVQITRVAIATAFVTLLASQVQSSLAIAVGINLLMLTLVSYSSHAMLAIDRPAPSHLTLFYLVIAAGGAVGGLLNGVIAPLVFDRVLEFPLLLLASPLLLFGIAHSKGTVAGRALRASKVRAALVLLGAVLVVLLSLAALAASSVALIQVTVLLAIGAISWKLSRNPGVLMFGMLVLLIVVASTGMTSTIHRVRTFYGSYEVQASGGTHRLVHGTTLHGTQFQDAERRDEPTTYYSKQGPLGDLFEHLDRGSFDRVAAIGLGTGTIAAYGRPGQVITFFEIDEAMARTAADSSMFSYLEDSDAEIETVIGDGRLKIDERPRGSFDLLILDAFSSDSIPVHLLTTEAMRLYSDRLAPEGVIALHISNRVFDLEPVVAGGVDDLGWRAVVQHYPGGDDGATASSWVVSSRDASKVEALLRLGNWRTLSDRRVTWTDDYSSVLAALR